MCLKLIIIVFFVNTSQAANILLLSMVPSPSHHIWNSAITHELVKRGHNVTVISPDAEEDPPSNITYILIENLYDDFHRGYFRGVIQSTDKIDPFADGLNLQKNNNLQCMDTVKSKGFKKLLSYPDNFRVDLVLYDFTIGPCLLPFLHKFNNPSLIATSAYGNPSWLNSIIGGHHYFSYIPHNSLEFDDNMNFLQRIYNFAVYLEEFVLRQYINIRTIDEMMKVHFGADLPSVGELEKRSIIALINTNPAVDFLEPLPENVISVGGLHIKDANPLPKDLERFLSSARKGVVLFSLGTNLRSEYISNKKQQLFINVFGQLTDYHFLWKFESNTTAITLPKNVQIRAWLPQLDILSHPNLKVFITHGGMLSVQESIWRGVPIIVVPFVFDQHINLIKAKKAGMAEGLDFLALTEHGIKETLLQVLQNPMYKRNAEQMSRRFRDQKEKPLERAIWWIEWVMRNPNAEHLKSPVLRLGYFVGHSFDVIGFVILLSIVFLFVLYKFFGAFFCFGAYKLIEFLRKVEAGDGSENKKIN